ncbi:50S ribosomal protein L1 [Candidatus Riesia pediculischaeffi]|uniref:Large ribosomal subunit protein uL1 n=1 Tax=Candidatus Riesia pediculischaeffi TaxID=428411 RepID=A0A1V0HL90_9ENTR|nr:50S ribosomal protein L1 [Candidatus Riesia pediculischaeffi]ARC53512.1 50S ribosomal protein L1 [Candidatus Riesia pediculischaeffi]
MKLKDKKSSSYHGHKYKKKYPLEEAIVFLKRQKRANFVESVDVSIQLGIDTKKTEQHVIGSFILPNSVKRNVRMAVFTGGESAEKAKMFGIKLVGMNDLAEKILKGENRFDIIIASSDAIKTVGKVSHIIGPKGMMPNLKFGTITDDIELCIKEIKEGKIFYRNDKNGIIHTLVGKVDLESKKIEENVRFFLKHLIRSKPRSVKGTYIKKMNISTTMGVGIKIDLSDVVS